MRLSFIFCVLFSVFSITLSRGQTPECAEINEKCDVNAGVGDCFCCPGLTCVTPVCIPGADGVCIVLPSLASYEGILVFPPDNDTTVCNPSMFNLFPLIAPVAGPEIGDITYGSMPGNYPNGIAVDVVVNSDTIFYFKNTIANTCNYVGSIAVKTWPEMISSDSIVTDTTCFDASISIELIPGFQVQIPSIFKANIVDCPQ